MLVVGLAPGLKGANATGRPFTGDYAGIVLYSALAKYGFATGEYKARADDGFTLTKVRITNAVRCVPPENKPLPEEAKACNQFLIHELAAMPNLKLILCLGLTSHQAVLRTLKLKQSEFKFGHGALHRVPPPLSPPVNGGGEARIAPANGESKVRRGFANGGAVRREEIPQADGAKKQGKPPSFTGGDKGGGASQAGGGSQAGEVMILNSYHTSRYNVQTGRLNQAMFDQIIAQAAEIV